MTERRRGQIPPSKIKPSVRFLIRAYQKCHIGERREGLGPSPSRATTARTSTEVQKPITKAVSLVKFTSAVSVVCKRSLSLLSTSPERSSLFDQLHNSLNGGSLGHGGTDELMTPVVALGADTLLVPDSLLNVDTAPDPVATFARTSGDVAECRGRVGPRPATIPS